MSAGHRVARLLGAALVLAVAATGPSAAAHPARQAEPDLELVAQSTGVDVGGAFALRVIPTGLPDGAQLRLDVHDRVRSRSELGTSSEGDGLRRSLHSVTQALTALPAGADGGRDVALSLAPSTPAGQAVVEPGVYPVAIDALDGAGRRLAGFVTHLVLRPPASPSTPPLAVTVLASVGAPPRLGDTAPLDDDAISDARSLVDALAAVPDVTATLAFTPDTLAGLVAGGTPEATELVDALRAVAANRPILSLPYVATSPDGLAEADLGDELAVQLDRGGATLADVLGVAPTQGTWLAGPDLGTEGLALLASLGVRRAIVDPAQVERVTDGVLTPARPFVLAPPRGRARPQPAEDDAPVEALLTDPRLTESLQGDEEPALVASRALAELAALWFEQPGTERAVVVPVSPEVDGDAVRAVLEGLRAASLYRTVPLDDAFGDARPLLGRDGDPLRRALDPEEPDAIAESVVDDLRELRDVRESVVAMVGPGGATITNLDAHLLRATGLGLDTGDRRAEVAAAQKAIDDLAAAIGTPETVTITLTAREGTVPLTIRNDTGGPVEVRVRLRSPKLELPGGDTFEMTLDEAATRLDIPVRTRASGSFPFDVEVTSPDGRVALASTRYSVRSTAVSGVGLVLSIGAGLFLIIWWARHWREHQRSRKLVAAADADV